MANPTRRTFEDDLPPPPRRTSVVTGVAPNALNGIPKPPAPRTSVVAGIAPDAFDASKPAPIATRMAGEATENSVDTSIRACVKRMLFVLGTDIFNDEATLDAMDWFIKNFKRSLADLEPIRKINESTLQANYSAYKETITRFYRECRSGAIEFDLGIDDRFVPLRRLFGYHIGVVPDADKFDPRYFKEFDAAVIPPDGARVKAILQFPIVDTKTGMLIRRGKMQVEIAEVLESRIQSTLHQGLSQIDESISEKMEGEARHQRDATQNAVNGAIEKVRGMLEPRIVDLEKHAGNVDGKILGAKTEALNAAQRMVAMAFETAWGLFEQRVRDLEKVRASEELVPGEAENHTRRDDILNAVTASVEMLRGLFEPRLRELEQKSVPDSVFNAKLEEERLILCDAVQRSVDSAVEKVRGIYEHRIGELEARLAANDHANRA